jgi:hypothetical protein
VFPVGVYPIVFVAAKGKPARHDDPVRYERMGLCGTGQIAVGETREMDYGRCFSAADRPWPIFVCDGGSAVVEKMRRFEPLSSSADVWGAATVAEAYKIRPLIRESPGLPNGALRLVNSGTIDRYCCLWGAKKCRYLGNSYLRPIVTPKDEPRLPVKRRHQARTPKIVVAGMTKRPEGMADLDGTVLAGKSTTIITSETDLRFLIAILNSRLVSFYYATVYGGNKLQGGYLRIGPPQLRTIPIPTAGAGAHGKHGAEIVNLVDRMLRMHERLQVANSTRHRTALQSQIAVADRQIDRFVYDLYGLTEDEIRVIEKATPQ